ncbi:hypothetical protein [Rhizobium sp. LjRoot254]|uniref:hypothetical protein n=1 Tax=Rhizobium sp. LjRoot254 TaxID=3342297 RepID=UPI003ECF4F71
MPKSARFHTDDDANGDGHPSGFQIGGLDGLGQYKASSASWRAWRESGKIAEMPCFANAQKSSAASRHGYVMRDGAWVAAAYPKTIDQIAGARAQAYGNACCGDQRGVKMKGHWMGMLPPYFVLPVTTCTLRPVKYLQCSCS